MTSEEISAVLGAGRGRAIGYLSGLRRSDLEAIAASREVSFTRETTASDLARRVVDQAAAKAKRAGRRRSR